MLDNTKLREDIAFVRATAERSKKPTVPGIYFVWALIGFCGFAIVDFVDDLRSVGIYWLFAGPVGFVISAWLGRRAALDTGLVNREEGIRHGLHWIAFMAAGILGLALVQAQQLTWQGFGSLWVLLLALTYFQWGLHLERRMLPLGLLTGGAYLVTIWVPSLGWTIAGAVLAIGLTTAAFIGARKRETAQ